MQSHVTKWGNSLALRLPRPIATDARLHEGTQVDLRLEGGFLIVRPARPKYKLSELLKGHPKPKRQKTRSAEIDWGKAEGEEKW
jgi:antitoxin MazE